ncbi:MAG TPA: hydrogenase expression/formation protein HypE, partial [Thermodesulfobacteriota bacterium]|nr:hydrogenase expression/formation protein HypE [Thermodesulfobacteriota bacterium]
MKSGTILLSHGAGGKLSHRLIQDVFLKAFKNPFLEPLNDQAVFPSPGKRLAFTTDSYVVSPIFFPGGDIGKLSVCGTINDLAVGGATPLYMSASFIIEEGLELEELAKVVESMAKTALMAGVQIVTGDTKVVEKGKADRLFINTAGVGVIPDGVDVGPSFMEPGDAVIISGTVGDHGVSVMRERGMITLDVDVESDCAPLHELASAVVSTGFVKAMRDPTRGGLITTLNELALSSGHGILVKEENIPVKEEVRGVCEILGFDPMYLANEGKMICIAGKDGAKDVLKAMRKNPLGKDAEIIGEVIGERSGKVLLETSLGTRRIMEMLSGEQLPRIC